jgi:hypothetical protein
MFNLKTRWFDPSLDTSQSRLDRRRQYLPKHIQNKTYNTKQRIRCSEGRWPARSETCCGEININKHHEELLWGTVLPITLIKYAQQDAEPQNKNSEETLHTVTEFYVDFLSPSRQTPQQYLYWATADSFQILHNSSFIIYLAAQR